MIKRIIAIAAVLMLLAVCFAGCGDTDVSGPEEDIEEISEDMTDEMFTDNDPNATVYVFQMNGRTYTADEYVYEVDTYGEPMEDGGFYKLTADVSFLNGGVAGYVDFPEIHEITGCEEVSPLDMDLPYITDTVYGLTLIGDYADGDVLLNEYRKMAVWKDGEWIYVYDEDIELEDGTRVCCREGVTEEAVESGIENGILSCEEYFVLPG